MANTITKLRVWLWALPLGPVLANIFTCHFEEKWVPNNNARPSIWFWYVDDTFILFDVRHLLFSALVCMLFVDYKTVTLLMLSMNYTIDDLLNRQQNRSTKYSNHHSPQKEIILVLPYLGVQSKITTKHLKTCIDKFCGCIDVRVSSIIFLVPHCTQFPPTGILYDLTFIPCKEFFWSPFWTFKRTNTTFANKYLPYSDTVKYINKFYIIVSGIPIGNKLINTIWYPHMWRYNFDNIFLFSL